MYITINKDGICNQCEDAIATGWPDQEYKDVVKLATTNEADRQQVYGAVKVMLNAKGVVALFNKQGLIQLLESGLLTKKKFSMVTQEQLLNTFESLDNKLPKGLNIQALPGARSGDPSLNKVMLARREVNDGYPHSSNPQMAMYQKS